MGDQRCIFNQIMIVNRVHVLEGLFLFYSAQVAFSPRPCLTLRLKLSQQFLLGYEILFFLHP